MWRSRIDHSPRFNGRNEDLEHLETLHETKIHSDTMEFLLARTESNTSHEVEMLASGKEKCFPPQDKFLNTHSESQIN